MIRNIIIIILLILSLYYCNGDFVYKDFNETSGLVFTGDAATTNCHDDPLFIF